MVAATPLPIVSGLNICAAHREWRCHKAICSRRQRSARTRWRNVLSVFSKVLVLINCATGPHRLSDCIGDWVSKGGTSRTVRPLEGNAFMVL